MFSKNLPQNHRKRKSLQTQKFVKRFTFTHKVHTYNCPQGKLASYTKLQSQMDLKWHKRISIDKSLRIASELNSSKDEPIKFSNLNANTQTTYTPVHRLRPKVNLWNVYSLLISLSSYAINLFANMLISNIVSRKRKNSRMNKVFECHVLVRKFETSMESFKCSDWRSNKKSFILKKTTCLPSEPHWTKE